MVVLPRTLLPDNASVDETGALWVGGVEVASLAAEFGTPLFVYDEAQLRARCREAMAAFEGRVSYASKAFLCKAMAKLVHEEGLHMDVASGGELHVALAAGLPATHLVMHGNNKSRDELAQAMKIGVGRVVVDSFDEMDRIDALVTEGASRPDVLLRVTPGIDPKTHEHISTGQKDSKFGFGAAVDAAEAIRRAKNADSMNLMGLHAHIGSQIFQLDPYRNALAVLAPLVAGLSELSLGGGLGVAYVASEQAATLTEWGTMIHAECERMGIEAKISCEPGRSIAAAAAITIYTVGTIKELPSIRTYVAVDGGMIDNPRPILYGSGYEAFLARETDAERDRQVTVVGKHCESGDVLVKDAWVPSDIAVGDLLCTPVTGAYGYAMGSNYNKLPRPAVVFVQEGKARVVVRRESYDDLMRCDV